MREGKLQIGKAAGNGERLSQRLDEFRPRALQPYDEHLRDEDIEAIAKKIKSDESLSEEEREALLHELTKRYDRTAAIPPYSHMGD